MGNRKTRRLNLFFPFTVILLFLGTGLRKTNFKNAGNVGWTAGELEGEWRAWGERGSAGVDECQGCGDLCVL